MNHRAEDDLLRSAAEGDEGAFTVLFRRYQRAVFQFAWRIVGSPETAEDLTWLPPPFPNQKSRSMLQFDRTTAGCARAPSPDSR